MNSSELMENEMKNVHTHSLTLCAVCVCVYVCARRYHYDEGKNGIDVTLKLIPVFSIPLVRFVVVVVVVIWNISK